MPKARQVLAGLQRDGWVIVRSRGSHRTLRKGERQTTWAWHDGADLGNSHLRQIGRQLGYTMDELREL